ncbi:uncharacterized protein LOC114277336 [Camellia sinensis]|uniref:uncharacterized protein LOC114277336 n=1 Tax=Camellia sinensis TaxID=4442 RepID=UPI001035DB48|nr:uncharacterized protein LOC114277336 [Camellia sinensis]
MAPPPPLLVQPMQDLQSDDRTIALTKEFKKMKPPAFDGGVDPLKVEAWVIGIEKLFEVFPCLEAQKVQLVTFTLENEARRWWMLISENNKGNLTVAEYKAKFTELAKFAPHIVDTDYKKVRKFEGGLHNDIQERVNVLKLPTYVDVLDRALMLETNMANQSRPPTDWKSTREGFFSKKESLKKQNTGSLRTSNSTRDTTPTCNQYGKKHSGVCYHISGACFKCGKMGYMVRDCTQNEQQRSGKPATSLFGPIPKLGNTTRPVTTRDTIRQGRVFALVPDDTRNTEVVVSDYIPIVREFLDVFPDELLEELADREIEFAIDVVPGT